MGVQMSKMGRIVKSAGAQRAMVLGGVALVLGVACSAPVVHAQSTVATGVGTPFELAFWQSIDSSSDPSLYEAYLTRYPNGTFSEIARAKIVALHGRTTPQSTSGTTAAPTVSPALTVPVAPPAPPASIAPSPMAPPAVYTQTAAPAPVASAPPAYATPAVVQPAVMPGPSAAAPSPGGAAPAAPAQSGATLGQLLAALANSQVTGAAAPAAPATVQLVATQPATVAPAPPRPLAAGYVVPAQPALVPVAAVALPPSFCSAEARNAFHDTVYLPSVNAAKQNNDAAAAYMRQLQSLYDQYQLSHDPDTMNAIVGAARTYQQVAQTTFSMQSALVRQFSALMTVPVVACSQPGQPQSATLAK